MINNQKGFLTSASRVAVNATIVAAVAVVPTAAEAAGAVAKDINDPTVIPYVTDQLNNVTRGPSAGRGWFYILNNGQMVVDKASLISGRCPMVLIGKHGVDGEKLTAGLMGLKGLPDGARVDLDDLFEVNFKTQYNGDHDRAAVNGDREYDFNNRTKVDPDFISQGIIPDDADYVDLKRPWSECTLVSTGGGDTTVVVIDYSGGCGPTGCGTNNGSDSGNTPGQPTQPGGNPLPIAFEYIVPNGVQNLDPTKPLFMVDATKGGGGRFLLQDTGPTLQI